MVSFIYPSSHKNTMISKCSLFIHIIYTGVTIDQKYSMNKVTMPPVNISIMVTEITLHTLHLLLTIIPIFPITIVTLFYLYFFLSNTIIQYCNFSYTITSKSLHIPVIMINFLSNPNYISFSRVCALPVY